MNYVYINGLRYLLRDSGKDFILIYIHCPLVIEEIFSLVKYKFPIITHYKGVSKTTSFKNYSICKIFGEEFIKVEFNSLKLLDDVKNS